MTQDEAVTTMHIGELAERTGLSLRTIRHYDEIGLLKPSGRTDGGFRLYTDQDQARLILIRRMKPLGFSLDEMMSLLKTIDMLDGAIEGPDAATVKSDLGSFIAQADERRQKLQEQLAMADEFLDLLRQQQAAFAGA
ncbi:MerR family transcriptional regulator [Cryobacterium zongtaii]|uniref:MerR family transcriptional regulator n=1 Tax=Cryobacterium zongtaii TaxID=1259217 RepID=A0A2S3ZLR5_9MICO|nr:MerR family transcriptional regulator [Cryobacterium zongtaii]POH69463.1 MerR family transcriptional regulator [Cryobacterium zongtaii]